MNPFFQNPAGPLLRDPGPGAPLSPEELGEHVAHMVWESYSDFMTSEELARLVVRLGIPTVDGVPEEDSAKELLILHLWAHTRAIQLGLAPREEAEGTVRQILDTLHRAVYDDLAESGYPRGQLPLFEQRVSARYADYYAAARSGDEVVGKVAARYLAAAPPPEAGSILTRRAVEVARPLRDWLEEVEIRPTRW